MDYILGVDSCQRYSEEEQTNKLISLKESKEIMEFCYEQLDSYYKAKTGEYLKENLSNTIHYYECPYIHDEYLYKFTPYTYEETTILEDYIAYLTNKMGLEYNNAFRWEKVVIPKTYYTNDHPYSELIIKSGNNLIKIEITDKVVSDFKKLIHDVQVKKINQ